MKILACVKISLVPNFTPCKYALAFSFHINVTHEVTPFQIRKHEKSAHFLQAIDKTEQLLKFYILTDFPAPMIKYTLMLAIAVERKD